ncbi:hypothetical protein [Streptomyces sp. H27-D2]|uniref:hypothetical protein n=1 Tax=Streptomyces sp. H27-D2 TaxID=3046304 RepID=UPI002DBA985A|nr:hypothetical protein [Streptomyces sp. H27-D2]MEC4016405.1 hypothetical protein [Streptomyces sp. H27-D2]
MDLLDWHRGRLSSRRLSVLVAHLPPDSATLHELHGDSADWSVTDHLLAAVVDHLAEANWMFATVNRDEESEALEFPVPILRPGMEEGPKEAPSSHGSAPSKPSAAQLTGFFS